MNRIRLKAVLAGGSSIAFDARPRAVLNGYLDGDGFFESRLLRNVLLVKLVEGSEEKPQQPILRTLLYFPFDPLSLGNGGRSLVYAGKCFRPVIERTLGIELNEEKFAADLAKLEVLARMPTFSPFLLRDAFERANVTVNRDFIAITDADADVARDRLKAKLKPLAAMALDRSVDLVGGGQLDLLVRKLWQLDDKGFLFPLCRALQIADDDAVDVFYSWIVVSHLQSEFVAREARVRTLAEWLAKRSTPSENIPTADIREYQAMRQFICEKLRGQWVAASDVFVRFDQSYRSLISAGGDPRPFVAFLKTVRADLDTLGVAASMLDQCLSVFDFWMSRIGTERVSYDVLRKIVSGMGEIWSDLDKQAAAAAAEPVKAAV